MFSYQEAMKLKSESRFNESLEMFLEIAKNKNVDFFDRENSYLEALKLFKILEKESGITEIYIDLATIYLEKSDNISAAKYFLKAVKIKEKNNKYTGRELFSALSCLKQTGEVSKIEELTKKYLAELVKYKKYHAGLMFLTYIEREESRLDVQKYKMIFYVQEGSFEKAEEILSDNEENRSKWWSSIEAEIKQADIKTRMRPVFIKGQLEYLLFKINLVDKNNILLKKYEKNFLKKIFQALIYYPQDSMIISLLTKYIVFFEVEDIRTSLISFLESLDDRASIIEDCICRLKNIEFFDIVTENEKNDDDIITGVDTTRQTSIVGDMLLERNYCINEEETLNIILSDLDIIEEEDINNQFKDIIIAYIMTDNFELALKAYEKLYSKKTEWLHSDYIELLFLKVNILFKGGRMYEALGLIDYLLQDNSINDDGLVDLLYVKAEILKEQGKVKDALHLYKRIAINRKHRLVEQRILDIEKY